MCQLMLHSVAMGKKYCAFTCVIRHRKKIGCIILKHNFFFPHRHLNLPLCVFFGMNEASVEAAITINICFLLYAAIHRENCIFVKRIFFTIFHFFFPRYCCCSHHHPTFYITLFIGGFKAWAIYVNVIDGPVVKVASVGDREGERKQD